LTDMKWLTPDRLVQQLTYADGRVLIANFRNTAWNGLGSDCVRVSRHKSRRDLCPPPLP